MSIWLSIVSFLGGPVVKACLQAYQFHLTATTTDKQTAADLAGKEIAAQTLETQSQTQLKIAEIGHPWEPEKLAFYVTLVFYAKILVWDKVIGSFVGCSHAAEGTCKVFVTDPVGGVAAVWAGIIMSFYFSKRGAENVAQIIKGIRS